MMLHGVVCRWLRVVAALVLVLVPALAAAESVVRVGGAGTGLGSMKLLAQAYQKTHPGVKIVIYPSLGSSGGIKALITGALDLALSGRELKAQERQQGAVSREYARTPFVFAANPSVAKQELTSRELEQIYLGKTTTWPDGSQLRLVLRPESDTDTRIIAAISPAMAQAVKAAAGRQGMIYAVTDQECDQALAKIAGALGPSTLAEAVTEGSSLKVLSFNGVRPSVKALAEGKYPLVKPLYLVTTAKSGSATQQFAQFVTSPQGRQILEKAGNLPSTGRE